MRLFSADRAPSVYTSARRDVVERVSRGSVRVPSVKRDTHVYAILDVCDSAYLSRGEYHELIAEVLDAVYLHLASMCGYSRRFQWRYKRLPAMEREERKTSQLRMWGACLEGILVGIASWESEKCSSSNPEKSFISHCLFWADQFADLEATTIRGEREGLLAEIELTLKRKLGPQYRDAKAAAVATGRYVHEHGCLPSKKELARYITESGRNGQRIAAAQRVAAYVEYEGGGFEETSSLHRVSTKDVPGVMSPYGDRTEEYDAVEILVKLRDQLFSAMAEDGVLTSRAAEISDLVLFGSLEMDSGDYACVDNSERVCELRHRIQMVGNREDLDAELKVLEEANTVTVPRPTGKIGAVRFPSGPLNSIGDRDDCRHLSGKWDRVKATALELRCRSFLAEYPGTDRAVVYAFLDKETFKDTCSEVRRVISLLDHYLYGRMAVPVMREIAHLELGHVPIAIRDFDFHPLRLVTDRPMVAWIAPPSVERSTGPTTGMFPRYSAIEEIKSRVEPRLLAGVTEERDIWVRCSKAEAEMTMKRIREYSRFNSRCVKEIYSFYKRETRILPIGPQRVGEVVGGTRNVVLRGVGLGLSLCQSETL